MVETLSAVEPDWKGMLRNLKREGTPERVYYFEHGIAENILDGIDARFGVCKASDGPGAGNLAIRRTIALHRFLGHELFRVFPPGCRVDVPRREGEWAEESRGPVTTWEEFDRFRWPKIEDVDLSVYEFLEHNLPENMRTVQVLDVWEPVRDLFGFETFCYKLYEDAALVNAVFERVGSFIVDLTDTICDFAAFGAAYLSDDLGYKTSLMLAPDDVRRVIFPWQKRLAELAHAHGKLCFLHSCGNMYDLMDEYIDYIGIDAKHSFEENVVPVTEAKRRYGDRLALLGGIDVDLLSRADEDTIRAKIREVLDACQPGGGYFLGSGNWVTEYIPVEHYLVMLDEARRWG